jgi:hypothetical protein
LVGGPTTPNGTFVRLGGASVKRTVRRATIFRVEYEPTRREARSLIAAALCFANWLASWLLAAILPWKLLGAALVVGLAIAWIASLGVWEVAATRRLLGRRPRISDFGWQSRLRFQLLSPRVWRKALDVARKG